MTYTDTVIIGGGLAGRSLRHRATGSANRGLTQVVAGSLVTGLAPQHPGEPFPRVSSFVFDGEVGQQRSGLLAGQFHRLTVRPERLEGAEKV